MAVLPYSGYRRTHQDVGLPVDIRQPCTLKLSRRRLRSRPVSRRSRGSHPRNSCAYLASASSCCLASHRTAWASVGPPADGGLQRVDSQLVLLREPMNELGGGHGLGDRGNTLTGTPNVLPRLGFHAAAGAEIHRRRI